MSTILGIESSCDDTGAAVWMNGAIVSNVVVSQEIHQKWGGVIPEAASRNHMQNIAPVIREALDRAQISFSDIQAVAYTKGPGLMGPLLVGGQFAKGLSQALNIPLIGVNHMKAHILAHLIEDPKPEFPFLCLTVSGGHTQIVWVKSANSMVVLGETLDDAAGEAFDKLAKLMGLPYPGGPHLEKMARGGDPKKYPFTIPQIPELGFSFSGLKTQVMYFLQKQEADFLQKHGADFAASIQEIIITILMKKFKKAIEQTGAKRIALAGGVSANTSLRNSFEELATHMKCLSYVPAFEYCTDNAGMIACAGFELYQLGIFEEVHATSDPRLKF
jgi:N6-L-threonylcarbamoyladenine synthase